jgi:hypothetical protein
MRVKAWTEEHFLCEALKRFIQSMLRSTLLHANKTTKKCIQFLNKYYILQQCTYIVFILQCHVFTKFLNVHIRGENMWHFASIYIWVSTARSLFHNCASLYAVYLRLVDIQCRGLYVHLYIISKDTACIIHKC